MNGMDLNKDHLSITEFANIVGTTAETLRHYDREGVFHAAKVGTGHENSNYRYYTALQITVFKMINVLTDLGVSLETVKGLATERTPEDVMKLLSKHKGIVAGKLLFMQEAFSVISVYLDLLIEGVCAIETEFSVSEMPERRIILGDTNDYSDSIDFVSEFLRFCKTPREPAMNLSFPIGGFFDSIDEFLDEPSKPTRFFSIDPKGEDKKPGGLYLIGYTRGYYGETGDLPERMSEFADANGLVFNGPIFNIYLCDELSIKDPNNYLLQVSASVKRTRRTHLRHGLSR